MTDKKDIPPELLDAYQQMRRIMPCLTDTAKEHGLDPERMGRALLLSGALMLGSATGRSAGGMEFVWAENLNSAMRELGEAPEPGSEACLTEGSSGLS